MSAEAGVRVSEVCIFPQRSPAQGHRAWTFLIYPIYYFWLLGPLQNQAHQRGALRLLCFLFHLSYLATKQARKKSRQKRMKLLELNRERQGKKNSQKHWLENKKKKCAKWEAGDRGRRQQTDKKGHFINTSMSFHKDREG